MSDVTERLGTALADRYRIERELGQGGMATVYLAEDLRHRRKVAIKVLHPELSAVLGPDRFLKEIELTASLQHPHILPLFDSGAALGLLYYVMPFVEGETLRSRLTREHQLPIAEAVRIASDVADALEYAHKRAVIHRDIKPENILLHDGRPQVADFGIALAVQHAGGSRMTQTGMSLGTPQYMAPEQAMGEKAVDARADVYALGAVAYEMLTGEPPFTGPTAQAIVAKVMTEAPRSIASQRHTVPPEVEAAVLTALEKLPADRFASAAQFAQALAGQGFTRTLPATRAIGPLGLSRRATGWLIGALGLTTIVAVSFAVWQPGSAPPARVARFALAPAVGQELLAPGGTRLAWSPDGSAFVYAGPGKTRSQLWLRRLDQLEPAPIAGTEGGTSPVFSPDGKEIGFVGLSPFSVKVTTLADGLTRTLFLEGASGGGLAWSDDGYLYSDGGVGMVRMRPDGSDRTVVLPLDTLAKEAGLAWPSALPQGRGILLRIRRLGDSPSDYRIVAYDSRDRSRKDVVRGVVAKYSPTGHLVWVTAEGGLRAQRFDLDRLEVTGEVISLGTGLAVGGFGASDIALSSAGDLLYIPGSIRSGYSQLSWVTRAGVKSPVDTTTMAGLIGAVALSPDGNSVALEVRSPTDPATLSRIWVKRLGGPTQLVTSENRSTYEPTWTPDGRYLLFNSDEGASIYRRRADGSGSAELVAQVPSGGLRMALHKDGKTLVVRGDLGAPSRRQLLRIRLGIDTVPMPLLAAPGDERSPAFSPDGRALAYASSESGRSEVYVRPYPQVESGKQQVSIEGGDSPRWNPAGGELFFLSASGDIMAARLETAPTLKVGRVTRLFTPLGFQGLIGLGQEGLFDVTPDGQRFLMLDLTAAPASGERERIVMVQNFATELRNRLPR